MQGKGAERGAAGSRQEAEEGRAGGCEDAGLAWATPRGVQRSPIQSGLAVPCQNVLSDFPREFRSKVQTENKYLSSLFFIFTILGN